MEPPEPSGISTAGEQPGDALEGWRGLAARLLSEPEWRGRLAIRITDALHREVDGLARDSELRDATRASTEENLTLFAGLAARGDRPDDVRLGPAAVDYVGLLIRRRMDSAVLAQVYRVAHGAFWRAWTGALHEALPPEAIGDALESSAAYMFAFMDAVTARALREHDEQRALWIRSPEAVRAETVRALIDGDPIDPQAAEGRLRHGLGRHHVGFVLWGASPEAGRPAELEALARRTVPVERAGPVAVLLHPLGRDALAGWISTAAAPAPLPAWDLGSGVLAAIGAPAPGVDGFRRTHHEAMGARRVAMLAGAAGGTRTAWTDVAAAALASADLDHAARFVRTQLGPLAADDARSRTWAETLRVHLEHGSSVRTTARLLGVHENTVANRLTRVRAALGRDLEGRVTDVLLALALLPVVRG
jgi:DNA-binding PucR family transcriptional regulator